MLNIKEVNKKITVIGKASTKLVTLIDEVMPSILFHAMANGQADPGIGLYESISPKHRATIGEYLQVFGPFTYNKKNGMKYSKEKAGVYEHTQGSDERKTWVESQIENMPLYSEFEGKADKTPDITDKPFSDLLKSLLNNAKKVKDANHKVTFASESEQAVFETILALQGKAKADYIKVN